MTKRKIRVAVLFGGRSAEHEVSLQSARSIVSALDKKKYRIMLVGISRQGMWTLYDRSSFLRHADDPKRIALAGAGRPVALVPGPQGARLVTLAGARRSLAVDAVFPVLHGPYGEDGTVQGLVKLAGAAFVGAGVTGSAVGMDKDVMKRLLRDAGLPVGKFLVFERRERAAVTFNGVRKAVGSPMFVKPACLGSSVGISKARSSAELGRAVKKAFRYDDKIIIEEFIDGREIECSVLGNDRPRASLPGEIVPQHEFYSYEAKYLDEKGALLVVPADLPRAVVSRVRDLAVKACRVLCCEGMARVDMFLGPGGRLFVNEINTIPGFTRISMYPKLWEASGLAYPGLLDRLVELALERRDRERRLDTGLRL
jgi:D-alanine-D-alanine ligase